MSLHIVFQFSILNFLIYICTDETHHFLLRRLGTERGVVQVGAVAAYGVDDQLDIGAYLLWYAGAPWIVVDIEQQEGHGTGREEVVHDSAIGAAVVGWNHPAVFRLQEGRRRWPRRRSGGRPA